MPTVELTDLQLRLLLSVVHDATYRANGAYEAAKQTPRFNKSTLEQRRIKRDWLQDLYNALPEPSPIKLRGPAE